VSERTAGRFRDPASARLAIGSWVVSIALTTVAVGLLVATWSTPVEGSWGIRGFLILLSPVAATVGAIVATRVPRNPVGWLLVATGLLAGIQGAAEQYAVAGLLSSPGVLPAPEVAAWLAGWTWIPGAACLAALLPLVFPTGHLRSRRWIAVVWFDVAMTLAASVGAAFLPGPLDNASYVDNPFALPLGPMTSDQRSIAYYPFILAVAVSIAPLVLRFRESTGEQRQQIKWLAWSAACLGASFLLVPLGQSGLVGSAGLKAVQIVNVLAFVGIPIAAGLAVLRYRLWDIDRIVSRTVSYALLTAVLVAIYAGGVLGVQALVSPLARSIDPAVGPLAVAASTLLAASLFQPLRRRIQGSVDRRFNRSRYDVEREAEAFAGRIRDEVDLVELRREVAGVVERTLEPARIGIWLRDSAGLPLADPGPARNDFRTGEA
jgi:hypothetical protein